MKSMLDNQMNNVLAEGGVMQEGGTVDPVSGNEVPVGAMQEEVRDDIDAKLSEGEFVFPADVVRFYGLEKLMMMRDKAKKGLQRMNEIGQMGNAEEVPDGEALFGDEEMDDDSFSTEIDDIIGETDAEAMGGTREFNKGGLAIPGTDYLAKYNIPRTAITNPALDVRAYKNSEGRVMYITFFNNKPSTPIPEGYIEDTGEDTATTKEEDKPKEVVTATETTQLDSGGDGGYDAPEGPTGGTSGLATDVDGNAMALSVTPGQVALGLSALSLAAGVPAVVGSNSIAANVVSNAINSLSHSLAAMSNVSTHGSPGAVDSSSQASSTAVTATTGPSGTGGAAASAAAAAASAAAASGLSAEAQGAASQAAANATLGGATASEAAAAGAAAATATGDASDPSGSVGGGGGDSSSGASDGSGPGAGAGTGGASAGDSGDGGTGAASSATGDFAKGGLVKKRKSSSSPTKQKGLASRK
jgi:hypothetical protein